MNSRVINASYGTGKYRIVLLINDCNENGFLSVRVQTIINKFFLIQNIWFESMEEAGDFISSYSPDQAGLFLARFSKVNNLVLPL